MKRSSFITWDQLKVGALIIVALIILVIAILKLGQAGNIFGKRYKLVAFIANASGLKLGGAVNVAGQLAGSIESIELLPPDLDTTRNLRLVVEVDRAMSEQVRRDSKGRIRTMGVLGDKVFDISPGTPRYRVLHEGDTLPMEPSVDFETVVQMASGAVTEVVGLTRNLQTVTGGINRGQGTLGQLVTNRALYDQLNAALARTASLMAALENPRGTVGRMLNDPTFYNTLNRTIASVDTVVGSINRGNGSVGKLLHDDTLYVHLVNIVAKADSLVGSMSNGSGTMQKLFTDQQLYDELVKTVTELNRVLADVRRDPRRYTPGLIKLF